MTNAEHEANESHNDGDGREPGPATPGETPGADRSHDEVPEVVVAEDVETVSEADAGHEETMDIEALADADPRSRGELLGELITAEEKRDEYLDDLRRSHADFENYRRRMMRDGVVQRQAGKADVVSPLLEILDDLDRTLEAAGGTDEVDLAKGVELVASKLYTALEAVGVRRIDEVGVTFDPNVHEAVQQRESEQPVEEPVVAQMLRPGYRLDDRVLRAAMVVVEQ